MRWIVHGVLGMCLVAAQARAGTDCAGGCDGDFNQDGTVSISELVTAVNHALDGCPTVAVTLQPLVADDSSITLTWDPVEQPGFQAYRIYRSEGAGAQFTIIGVLSDPGATTFRDTTVAFGITYSYYVALLTGAGQESHSNVQQGTAGSYVEINGQVEALLADPTRPYLYALDRVNNSLYFINLGTRQVEKTIFVGSIPTDMDIDASATELFVANFGSTEIAVVDLATQEKTRSLFVDVGGVWDGNPYRLACGPQGTLVFTGEDQWNDLTLIETEHGATLSNVDSVYQPDLVASPDRTRIYVSEYSTLRYDIVGQSLMRTDSVDGGGFYGRIVTSGDGKYVFSGARKLLANNLKAVLGSFSEGIFASNLDGSLVIGNQHVFNGNTFSILRPLPVQTQTMTIAANGQTLYLYDVTSSRIYFFNLSTVN
jgi:YVTN family beta-propeller protein